MDSFFDSFDDAMKRGHERNKELRKEFDRRNADLPDLPQIGDTVILIAGLIGRGHIWERIEGECIKVGENTAKVKYQKSYDKEPHYDWVPAAAIADIIRGD